MWKRLYLASCTGVRLHAARRSLATPSLTVCSWCTGVPGSLTTGAPGNTRRWRPLPGLVTLSSLPAYGVLVFLCPGRTRCILHTGPATCFFRRSPAATGTPEEHHEHTVEAPVE